MIQYWVVYTQGTEFMSFIKKLTKEERHQGWYALDCGKHAYIFRSDLEGKIPANQLEYCPECESVAVKIEAIKELTARRSS